MSVETFDILIEHILEKCRREHWYGSDMSDPDDSEKYDYVNGDHCVGRVPGRGVEPGEQRSHPQRLWFASPPASEQELQEVEERIGCPLPPFLRLLYGKLANGGFGPGYGLSALKDLVVPRCRDDYRAIALEECPVDEATSAMVGRTCRCVPDGTYIKQLLELVNWGCGSYSYLDARTGQVFWGPGDEFVFCLHMPSFEEYMELWARDEMVFPCVVPQNGK